jgi:hypothetical protein
VQVIPIIDKKLKPTQNEQLSNMQPKIGASTCVMTAAPDRTAICEEAFNFTSALIRG